MSEPCTLTTKDGRPNWCERHGEHHHGGLAALSQDAGPRGVEFRRVRDKYARNPGAEVKALQVEAQRRASPVLVSPARVLGPGSFVAEILKQRGITPRPGCGCRKIMNAMDEAGVENVRRDVDAWAERMKRNKSFMSWSTQVFAAYKVALGPMVKGLWNTIRGRRAMPKDRPYLSFRALILDACELAEESERRARPRQVSAGPAEVKVVDVSADPQAALLRAAQNVSFHAPPRPWGAPLRWAVGLTCVPERAELLDRTLASLVRAGFEGENTPRLFFDGEPSRGYSQEATVRSPRLPSEQRNPWGNWWLGMHELFMRRPDADRYVMFQDDLMAVRNLRQYLEACPFPERGYLNLFTFSNNEALAGHRRGWVEAALMPKPSPLAEGSPAHLEWASQRLQCGRGALGLVFDRAGLLALLGAKECVERPLEHPAGRGLRRIDGGIVTAMNRLGYREWVHDPSLLQHTGVQSTCNWHKLPRHGDRPDQLVLKRWRPDLASTFPGEEFDVMEMVKKNQEAINGVGQDHQTGGNDGR